MNTLKKTSVKESEELSPELLDLLAATRPVDEIDKDALAESIRALETSPQHVADTRKASFVEDVLRSLNEQGLTKSELARRLGKTRQQLNHMLNEKKLNNFTIETMAQISAALGTNLFVRMLASHEDVRIDSSSDNYVRSNKLKDWEAEMWNDLPLLTNYCAPPIAKERTTQKKTLKPTNIIPLAA